LPDIAGSASNEQLLHFAVLHDHLVQLLPKKSQDLIDYK